MCVLQKLHTPLRFPSVFRFLWSRIRLEMCVSILVCDSVLEMAPICYGVFPDFSAVGWQQGEVACSQLCLQVLFRAWHREFLLIKKCGPQASCLMCLKSDYQLCVLQIPASLSKQVKQNSILRNKWGSDKFIISPCFLVSLKCRVITQDRSLSFTI